MPNSVMQQRTPYFMDLFAAEERHFWFRARGRIIAAVIKRLTASLNPGYRVLEVGCGTGHVLRELEHCCPEGEVMGCELHEQGVELARQRVQCPVAQANIYDFHFEQEFDVIGLFDVLEHLPEADQALRSLYDALAPGGRLVLTVPAHAWLWSHVDVVAEHYLRYSPAKLGRTLQHAGFEVSYLTQFMLPLAPLMFLGRRLASLIHGLKGSRPERAQKMARGELRVVPVLNRCLTWLLSLEAPLIARGWRLPLGASLLAVAVKPHCQGKRAVA